MSPKRPVFNRKQIERALLKKGFLLIRQKASHKIFGHPERPELRVTVPDHGTIDLKPGTLRAILKQADLTADDITAAL